MGRDWESQFYFPQIELTGTVLATLLNRLLDAGLRLEPNRPGADQFPAMEAITEQDHRVAVAPVDVERLLRTKPPPLGPGYGVIALRCREPWTGPEGVAAFLSFGRFDLTTGLDSLLFVIDDGAFYDRRHRSVPEAFDRCFQWFALLAGHLEATYAWGDWEDIWIAVAPPTRTQAAAGKVGHLFRLNCFGPALVARFGAERLRTTPARLAWPEHGAAVVGVGLTYAGGTGEERAAAANHLGLQPATPVAGS